MLIITYVSIYHAISLSTESFFSDLKSFILEISTVVYSTLLSHESSVTFRNHFILVINCTVFTSYSLFNIFHACTKDDFLYNGEKQEELRIG